MTKTLSTTFAAALVAASAFGATAAFAAGNGDYYQGAQPTENVQIDRATTQSIHNGAVVVKAATSDDVGPANGDYYQGVSKR